jgi:hypothetical protein
MLIHGKHTVGIYLLQPLQSQTSPHQRHVLGDLQEPSRLRNSVPAVPVPATCASDVMINLKSNGLPGFISKPEQHGATCMCVCVFFVAERKQLE